MRTEIRNELSPVVGRAVSMARVPGAQSFGSSAGARSFSAPADYATSEGIGGGGEIITVFPAMTDVDFTDDPTAVTTI